jgi:transposase
MPLAELWLSIRRRADAGRTYSGRILWAGTVHSEILRNPRDSVPCHHLRDKLRDFPKEGFLVHRDETEIRAGQSAAEQVLKDRRQTRRQYSAEERISIVLEGLRDEENISELCRREGIAASMYYGWSKEFLEAGKRRLAGDTARAATSGEAKDLRREPLPHYLEGGGRSHPGKSVTPGGGARSADNRRLRPTSR